MLVGIDGPDAAGETTLADALAAALPGEVHRASVAEVGRRYRTRYLPGQALYRAEIDPERAADVLVDHRDPARPRMLRWGRS